jgi:hypothetical protein
MTMHSAVEEKLRDRVILPRAKDQRRTNGAWFGSWLAGRWKARGMTCARFVAFVTLVLVASVAGFAGISQASGGCPNEARRVEQGSTYLPDCRAYELVTPSEKGATQALDFGLGGSIAIPAENGEKLALQTNAYLGGNPGSHGTNVVFSRGVSGWEMASLQPLGAGETIFNPTIFTSDLTQVGVEAYSEPGKGENRSPTQAFEVGPSGGPYSTLATTPSIDEEDRKEGRAYGESLVGASSDFSHIVLSSLDSNLLPPAVGPSETGVPDLYDSVDGQLHIVNVMTDGKLVSECGAVLGRGMDGFDQPHESNAVWSEGSSSKIFFTSPLGEGIRGGEIGPGCTGSEGGGPHKNPHRLYMRVNDNETVEVSAPQLEGAIPCDPGTWSAFYQGASADGSKVFFTTESELTADSTACRKGPDVELYEYNTTTGKLTRISRGEPGTPFSEVEAGVETQEDDSKPIVSQDGSTVYFEAKHKLTEDAPEEPAGLNLYRYDTVSGTIRFVAVVEYPTDQGEGAYTTPNGEFYVFSSKGVSGESRGQGHNEMYRYDNSNRSVICVSCGSGATPLIGNARNTNEGSAILEPGDLTPRFVPMSDDGHRVFFVTSARLVPQDTNSLEEGELPAGQDVYEWEATGTEEAPGLFCREANGCTHLITSGKDENISLLLGASPDGSNVFFATSARLVPQDTDDLPDIYDARVDGGFAAPAAPVRCSGESCRLIPSASPVISTPLSATFSGVGNIVPSVAEPLVKPGSLSRAQKLSRALKACRKTKKKRAGCEAQARKRYGSNAGKSARGGR